ncbi:hypothetical protein Tsubulata_048266 [Turnera subulata]|uniref:Ribosome-inactivating protein n=1 Tax=Turnera subulata TaxID=218843 RepID=A0A9Q0GLD0_9ROSI|nr:hypothetical protein Tsubulata_048266 [Turnera subulata]
MDTPSNTFSPYTFLRLPGHLATFLLLVAVIGPEPAWGSPLALEEDEYALGLHSYQTVEFTTEDATKESYTEFLGSLRQKLASDYKRHEIPVLPEPYAVADEERFLLVKLTNEPGAGSITVALDVTDANVVAYQAGHESYFFNDASNLAFSNLFTRTEKKKLSFSGQYPELEKAATANRQGIDLGIPALEAAISSLYRSNRTPVNTLARSLMVVMQMISEAARFRYVEQQVRFSNKSGGYGSFRPDQSVLALESNWNLLSSEIQESYQRAFSNVVQLKRSNGETLNVDSVSPILKPHLALLKFLCKSTEPTSTSGLLHMVSDYDDACLTPEPTMKIMGRHGACIDVWYKNYTDGNKISLYKCVPGDTNQVWTFKRDGTIRCNGKCLTTYNFGPQSYIMIFDCDIAPKPTTLWVFDTNGSIVNPVSGLSLSSSLSDSNWFPLSLETRTYATNQGWVPGNNTQPFASQIVGFKDLCLEAKASQVLLQECASGKIQQQWSFYADGTIRPKQNANNCLTSNSQFKGTEISILDCGSFAYAWPSQRWILRNDGAIMNPENGLVMEARESSLNVHGVIISPPTGNPNQKWLPLF